MQAMAPKPGVQRGHGLGAFPWVQRKKNSEHQKLMPGLRRCELMGKKRNRAGRLTRAGKAGKNMGRLKFDRGEKLDIMELIDETATYLRMTGSPFCCCCAMVDGKLPQGTKGVVG